jgi:hypothetical protein
MMGHIIYLFKQEANTDVTAENFNRWAQKKAKKDQAFYLYYTLAFKILTDGYMYRFFSRSNLASEKNSCMQQLGYVFHITNAVNYALIDVATCTNRARLRDDINDMLDSNDTLSLTGHPLIHQWPDELIEQANKQVKRQTTDGQKIKDWNTATALADFRGQTKLQSKGEGGIHLILILIYFFIGTTKLVRHPCY